jgi:hypothetical protein
LKQILQGCLCVGVGLHRIHVAGVKMWTSKVRHDPV